MCRCPAPAGSLTRCHAAAEPSAYVRDDPVASVANATGRWTSAMPATAVRFSPPRCRQAPAPAGRACERPGCRRVSSSNQRSRRGVRGAGKVALTRVVRGGLLRRWPRVERDRSSVATCLRTLASGRVARFAPGHGAPLDRWLRESGPELSACSARGFHWRGGRDVGGVRRDAAARPVSRCRRADDPNASCDRRAARAAADAVSARVCTHLA